VAKRAAVDIPSPATAVDKIANLLALLLVKDSSSYEAIVTLTRAGFSNMELCLLLGTTSVNVRQANFQARRGNTRKGRKGAASR
jgi:hypothetical protein